MKPVCIPLVFAAALAGCADSSLPDITSDISGVPQPDNTTNDTFFNADLLPPSGKNSTLGADDPVDYYRISGDSVYAGGIGNTYNGTLIITLSNMSGDADIELFDSDLNRLSWSNNRDMNDEEITVWYDASANTDLDTRGLHFVKVSLMSDGNMNYSLNYRFE